MVAPRSLIIVGAGAAGLHAAALAQRAGAVVTLLEASDTCGGRLRALTGFAPWPIELGAEELHGERSLPYRLARERGLALRPRGDALRLFLDLASGSARAPAADDDALAKAHDFLDALPSYAGPPQTLAAAIAGLPPRARAYLDAVLGNEYGASSERLGLHELALAEEAWEEEGTRNFIAPGGPLLRLVAADAPRPLLGQVVDAIDWASSSGVAVTTRGGARFCADQALFTAPLPVLRDGDVRFTPLLPAAQRAAARGIGCGPTLKIFLRFKQRLWPARRTSLTILGAPRAPELWTAGARAAGLREDAVLTALLSGAAAEAFLMLGRGALPALLADLDQALAPLHSGRASRALVDHLVQDWSAAPFTRCGYSYPTPGSAPLRHELARPLRVPGEARPRVAFAGEATHPRLFGSLQGALLSAERAVNDLLL